MIESAQGLLTFPCAFPIKAIGRTTVDFEATVVAIIRRHAPQLDPGAIVSRASQGGRYLSITATITAESRAQLDALYQELSGHEQVLMVL